MRANQQNTLSILAKLFSKKFLLDETMLMSIRRIRTVNKTRVDRDSQSDVDIKLLFGV
jgi:hypothetical protein